MVQVQRILSTTILTAVCACAQDARAIIEKSVHATDRTTRLAEQYTYRELTVQKENGKTTTRLYEILTLGAKRYRHQIEKDGKPLPETEARKERGSLDRAAAEATRLTPEEREKREKEWKRRNQEERDKLKYVPEAFDFTLAGQTVLNGRAVYEIVAIPKPTYRGKYEHLLRNMRGRFFIDKADYQWVRVEAEALDNIYFGLILARISKGARFTLEVTKVNNEIWLPKHLTVDASGTLALLKRFDASVDITYSDYRKFQAESRITSISDGEGR